MTTKISKPKFSYHDCECCGSFSSGSFKVTTPHGRFEHFHDGHFGSGDWNGQDYTLYLLAIKDMFDAHYIHLETDDFTNTYGAREEIHRSQMGVADEAAYLELNPDRSIKMLVQESKRKVTLEVGNSTYFFPPSIWLEAVEYYEDEEYVNYDVLFKHVFDQLNLLHFGF
jgi:hypothetical protein